MIAWFHIQLNLTSTYILKYETLETTEKAYAMPL